MGDEDIETISLISHVSNLKSAGSRLQKQNAFPVSEEGVHLVVYLFTPYDYRPPDLRPVVVVVVVVMV
jgi:hypothetical protein